MRIYACRYSCGTLFKKRKEFGTTERSSQTKESLSWSLNGSLPRIFTQDTRQKWCWTEEVRQAKIKHTTSTFSHTPESFTDIMLQHRLDTRLTHIRQIRQQTHLLVPALLSRTSTASVAVVLFWLSVFCLSFSWKKHTHPTTCYVVFPSDCACHLNYSAGAQQNLMPKETYVKAPVREFCYSKEKLSKGSSSNSHTEFILQTRWRDSLTRWSGRKARCWDKVGWRRARLHRRFPGREGASGRDCSQIWQCEPSSVGKSWHTYVCKSCKSFCKEQRA